MKNERSGKPSKLGIAEKSGYCMACGLPRATVPVKAKIGAHHFWIHAKCKAARFDGESEESFHWRMRRDRTS